MKLTPIGDVIVNGAAVAGWSAAVPVHDVGLLRGYGCFEVLRSYRGVPFRLEEHLDRLETSAQRLGIPLPGRGDLERWVIDRATAGDVLVRIVVTGGTDIDALGTDAKTIVFAHEAPARPETMRVCELAAPWHPAGATSELVGVKALSYAPNEAAHLYARNAGYDDAVLLDRETTVLELPMASIGWAIDQTIETPGLGLGILRSVTRSAVLEIAESLGIPVLQGAFPATRLHAADEVFVMSTTKEVVPVVAVGTREYDPGPITARLVGGFDELVAATVRDGRRLG